MSPALNSPDALPSFFAPFQLDLPADPGRSPRVRIPSVHLQPVKSLRDALYYNRSRTSLPVTRPRPSVEGFLVSIPRPCFLLQVRIPALTLVRRSIPLIPTLFSSNYILLPLRFLLSHFLSPRPLTSLPLLPLLILY